VRSKHIKPAQSKTAITIETGGATAGKSLEEGKGLLWRSHVFSKNQSDYSRPWKIHKARKKGRNPPRGLAELLRAGGGGR